MNVSRTPPGVRGPRRALALAAALAVLLGACGGGEPEVETSTIEMDPDAGAALPAEADPGAADPGLTTGADEPVEGAIVAGADALGDGADAVAAGADDAWTSLQANWADSVEDVRAHFGELSEGDILATGGDRRQLVAVVQERYNLAPEEAEQQVADWEATL